MEDVVQKTILSYETKADEYIRNTDQLSYFPGLPSMLDMFLSMLPGKQVLDVAFGSGRDTLYFLKQDLEVQGIELTQSFINFLQRKVEVPLYKMDMRELTFDDASFDGIWCCSSFLHIPREDALRTLKGFYRVLRLKGILYIDLKEDVGERWVQNNDGHLSDIPRFFTYYQLEEICALLEDTGFKVEYKNKQPHPKYAHKHSWLNIFVSKGRVSE